MGEVVLIRHSDIRAARHPVATREQAVALAGELTARYVAAGLEHVNPADLEAGCAVLVGRASMVRLLVAKVHSGSDDAADPAGRPRG